MKKLLISLILCSYLIGNDFINLPLKEFIAIVSKTNQINIIVDENIDQTISFYLSNTLPKKGYFNALKKLLKNKNMIIVKHKDFYMIKKTIEIHTKEDIPSYHSIKLNFVEFKDIENFLKVYGEDIKYQFIHSSKILLVKAKKEDFNSIKKVINLIDILPKQLKLKITILETNLDKLKEHGMENILQIHSDSNTNFFYNLIAYPFTITNDISSSQKSQFYSFLKLTNQNENSKFLSSPILTLSDNKEVKFDVATTIPYSTGSTTIDEETSKTTTSLSYKDVGLKLSIVPRIYNNSLVYLDLELEVSNIISNSENTPIVSKKYIKQSFYLDSGKIFVLTGINQRESIKTLEGIPTLMDIPYLGWLFKSESINNTNTNLSIFFEIISPLKASNELQLSIKGTSYDQL